MNAETNKRIIAYREALPHMRERVAAALLMLVIAAVVTVTAAYAWVVLSFAPEVSGLATTLAANGSLEIALAKEDGSAPDEFDVDESATADSAVTATNLQWGNLVNLSDDSYNINNLALRPARLNTASLLNNPLWGAVYSADGRVNNLDSNYAYVKYDTSQKTFMVAQNSYGVRAIASYKATIAEGTQKEIDDKREAAFVAHNLVNTQYQTVAGTFAGLGDMISAYAQDKVSGTNTDLGSYFGKVLTCYYALRDAMEAQKDAYVALANFQNYMYINNHKDQGFVYADLTWEELVAKKNEYNAASAGAASSNGAVALTGLTQFISDLNTLNSDIAWMEKYKLDHETRSGSAYYWSGKDESPAYPAGPNISSIVDRLVGVYTMTADLKDDGNETKLVSLSTNDLEGLLSAVTGGARKVYIYNGIMIRFEQLAVDNAYRLNGNAACTIKIKYYITVTINGKAYTKAAGDCYYMLDYTQAIGVVAVPADATAEDTYGLVVDLWLRTNAEETLLTLEGATTVDSNGAILSYDGVNRVWGATGDAMLTTDSTTQGGGSCYVYYADTPEDMNRSLNLLESMKVAFVDQSGNLLATAEMDTVNYYAVNGRVTVPLVLNTSTQLTYSYVDKQNTQRVGRAITTMYADQPIRVTAIIYLDGDTLSNDDVLAEAEIQGRLNLQFGSSVNLKTIGSSELIDDTRVVTAQVTRTEMDYDDPNDERKTTVTVTVEGTTPERVTASFLRAINNYQGTREGEMTFEKMTDGTWQATWQFRTPGTYWLRYVTVNGVEYTLEEPQKVEVSGFELSEVTWDQSEVYDAELDRRVAVIRTSESTHTVKVNAQFAASAGVQQPTSVRAHFVREDGNTVSVNLNLTGQGFWTGTGTFTTSGVYTLQYLVVDGAYRDLASRGLEKNLDLSLGMYVSVENLRGALEEEFESDKTYSRDVAVRVYDNTGKELEGLTGLKLYYAYGSSTSATVNTDLTWEEIGGRYTGTMAIKNAGRYRFSHVELSNTGTLTRCTESPVYTFISPEPPVYDAVNSSCTLNNADGIQFVPLTNDARIDKIMIGNATDAVAVVYNEKAGYQEAELKMMTSGQFYCELPTYRLPTGQVDDKGEPILGDPTQDGTWTVAAIKLYNCYGEDGTLYDKENPLLWAGTEDVAKTYLTQNGLTAKESYDFSNLRTTVSGSLNVTFAPGTTKIGGTDEAFMSDHYLSKIGMSVSLTDDAGRVIPGKLADVTLTVKYVPDPDNTAYGYKVQANASRLYTISLNRQEEDGRRTLSSNDENWQYVGEYRVEKLTVVVGSQTLDFAPGSNGVPEKYTVTTGAPTAENITVSNMEFKTKLIGKSGDTVTGYFLDGGNPGVKVGVSLGEDAQYAIMDDVTMKTVLTYEGGSDANGGYTISGDNSLKTVELDMTLNGNTYSSVSTASLLAGNYKVEVKYSIDGGEEKTETFTERLQVYSAMPDVKITGVSPATEVTVNSYTGEDNYLTAKANTFKAKNQFGDYYAVVYMQYEQGDEAGVFTKDTTTYTSSVYSNLYAYYTAPVLELAVENIGNGTTTLHIAENGSNADVVIENGTHEITIGRVVSNSQTHEEVYGKGSALGTGYDLKGDFIYRAENAYPIGTQTIEYITSTVNGETYERKLEHPLVISQSSADESILEYSIDKNMSITVAEGNKEYASGMPVSALTTLTVTVNATEGYYNPRVSRPVGAIDWTVKSEGEETAVYSFKMPSGNVQLTGSVSAYPTLTYNSNGKADVTVQVNGTTVNSGTRVKTGATVTVTATAKTGFYAPALSATDATGWTQTTGNDDAVVYTFTMPNADVTIAAPNAQTAYPLNWTDTGEVKFAAEDTTSHKNLQAGSYVPPGHTVEVTVTSPGGQNPELTSPGGTERVNGSTTAALYRFTMPNSDVTLAGKAKAYPMLTFGNNFASVSLKSAGQNVDFGSATQVGIMSGNVVEITLTAKAGYYAPRMTEPTGVTGWQVVSSEGNKTATYSFIMPTGDDGLDIRSCISATSAPTVTLAGSGASLTLSGTNYDGSALSGGNGTKVQPGTVVTVTAKHQSGYYAPTVTASGATLSGRSPTGTGYDEATYTFTMGTSDVTLTAGATVDPTVTVSLTNGIGSATVNGTATSKKVHPGETVTVAVTAGDDYHSPILTEGVSGLTSAGEPEKYVSHKYIFTMPTEDVTLSGKATVNPQLIISAKDTTTVTATAGTMPMTSTGKIRPGTTVTVVVAVDSAGIYYAPVVTVSGGISSLAQSGSGNFEAKYKSFEMPTTNVNLTGTATEKPYIIFDSVGECVVKKDNNSGADISAGENGKWYVMPGDTVAIYARNTDSFGWFSGSKKHPKISLISGEATLSSPTTGEDSILGIGYKNSTYKVTVTAKTGTVVLNAVANSISS